MVMHWILRPLIGGAALLVVFTKVSAPAEAAQDRTASAAYADKATEIMANFGANGVLAKAGLQKYLAATAFAVIDTEKDGQLSFEEWYAAYLYCRPDASSGAFACADDSGATAEAFEQEMRGAADERLTADTLPKQNAFWRTYFEARTDNEWRQVDGGQPAQWSLADLQTYLRLRAERSSRRRSVDQRIADLRTASGSDTVTQSAFEEFAAKDIFLAADSDGSADLDIYETKAAFPVDSFLPAYMRLSGADMRVSWQEFTALPRQAGPIDKIVAMKLLVAWNLTTPSRFEPLTIAKVERNFQKQYDKETARLEAQARQQADKAVSGAGFVPNRGLILSGNRRYDKVDERVEIDWTKPALAMRVVKDFTKADNKASPADFSYTKDASEDPILGVNAAVRFDYYNPEWYDYSDSHSIKPAVGFQWNRSGNGSKRQDIKRIYGLIDWFWSHGDIFWTASQFQIGPVYELDTKNNIDKLTGLVEFEPLLRIGPYSTGVYIPLVGDGPDALAVYVRPRLAFEFGDIVDEPAGSDTPDTTFFRYGAELGVRLVRNITVKYSVSQYKGIDGEREDHTYHDATLNWMLDPDERYSVVFGYKKGETAPTFTDIEQFRAGLGVKF